jgi:hypothetical protein
VTKNTPNNNKKKKVDEFCQHSDFINGSSFFKHLFELNSMFNSVMFFSFSIIYQLIISCIFFSIFPNNLLICLFADIIWFFMVIVNRKFLFLEKCMVSLVFDRLFSHAKWCNCWERSPSVIKYVTSQFTFILLPFKLIQLVKSWQLKLRQNIKKIYWNFQY